MRRREFLALSGAVVGWPASVGWAQQAGGLRRIVVLSTAVPADVNWQALVQGLADHGYAEGRNILLERAIAPNIDAVGELAARVVAGKPDIIVCFTTPSAQAAKSATTTIPIVIAALNDPVGNGLVASLARPGGNVTGNTQTTPDLAGTLLAVLRELLPTLRRVAVLALPSDPSLALIITQIKPAAETLKIEPVVIEFDDRQQLLAQLERVARADVQAFLVIGAAYFVNAASQQVTADFQARTGIARVSNDPSVQPFVGVMAYGANTVALRRQVGAYIDAIFNGTRPADLPVQQPTIFDLAINLKTAKALGLTVTPSLFAQATILVE